MMAPPTKIATCSYCGTRAALVLERGRHELSCTACGAPLHEMKALRLAPDAPRKPAMVAPKWQAAHPEGAKVRRPRKRRKGLARKLLEEVIDLVEDIFD